MNHLLLRRANEEQRPHGDTFSLGGGDRKRCSDRVGDFFRRNFRSQAFRLRRREKRPHNSVRDLSRLAIHLTAINGFGGAETGLIGFADAAQLSVNVEESGGVAAGRG
jgi:hypothetical protein